MEEVRKLSRRDLLRQSVSLGTVFVMGTGFIAAPNAARAAGVFDRAMPAMNKLGVTLGNRARKAVC